MARVCHPTAPSVPPLAALGEKFASLKGRLSVDELAEVETAMTKMRLAKAALAMLLDRLHAKHP